MNKKERERKIIDFIRLFYLPIIITFGDKMALIDVTSIFSSYNPIRLLFIRCCFFYFYFE